MSLWWKKKWADSKRVGCRFWVTVRCPNFTNASLGIVSHIRGTARFFCLFAFFYPLRYVQGETGAEPGYAV